MPNITDSEIAAAHEFVRLLRNHGAKLGNDVNALIAEGHLDPYDKVRLVISADNIRQMSPNFDSLPLVPSLFMKLGAPESSTMVNGMITGSGVVTAGYSAIRLTATTNPAAKGFYGASIIFSSGAVASGGIAVATRMCRISETALLSEVIGAAFLWLGEMAHAQALRAEGKPIPAHLRKWANPRNTRFYNNNQNLSFVMPGNFNGMFDIGLSEAIQRIPFERIGQIVGVGLTFYGYYKIVITSYRYSQKLISKFQEKQQKKLMKYRSTLLRRQAKFLVISCYRIPSVQRIRRIQKFVVCSF